MADHRAPPRVLCAVEPITAPRMPAWARMPPEALGGWCLLRSSKPLSGAGCGVGGGFDSHALPPPAYNDQGEAKAAATPPSTFRRIPLMKKLWLCVFCLLSILAVGSTLHAASPAPSVTTRAAVELDS